LLVTQVLRDTFGYQQLRPGQQAFINAAIDSLILVVSPLISLMKDQVDQLLAYGVSVACYNLTQTREQQLAAMAGCRSG
jgi:ATP-dependent DNA helicase RecQ